MTKSLPSADYKSDPSKSTHRDCIFVDLNGHTISYRYLSVDASLVSELNRFAAKPIGKEVDLSYVSGVVGRAIWAITNPDQKELRDVSKDLLRELVPNELHLEQKLRK